MTMWAIDLGTTNTGVAQWDQTSRRPRLLELERICRKPGGDDHLEAPRLVPSATHALDELDFWTRVGQWRALRSRVFWGCMAYIGRPALELNQGQQHACYAPAFKPYLTHMALKPLARAGKRALSARDIAYLFVRELFAEVRRTTGERVRDLVVTTPVESYEAYRAEVRAVMERVGVGRLRFIDEPVAAAIGYGLSLERQRYVLVIDIGGGTLDLALVAMRAHDIERGTCEVLAKEGRAIGGNLVDRWLLDDFCARLEYPLREDADEATAFWYRLMLDEARRVKEAVFFKEAETFYLTPPEDMRSFEARLRGDQAGALEVSRADIVAILERQGLYRELETCLDGILSQAHQHGIGLDDIGEVLMVGGSTLLPDVYPAVESRFGRDRVRAWQPFEAVAYGAAAFAAGQFTQSDFIVHDYAFLTYDAKTHEPEYTTIIKRGTRFPTEPGLWKRKLIPTCSLGEPETEFKLVIAEIGRNTEDERHFGWDAQGRVHKLGGKESAGSGRLIVPLNESNPTLGFLDPPHMPSDKRPRLEIGFGINADRWLSATVVDLQTKKHLMREEPVVRLL
jgi:molecular chaperone DnaK (HSP70)